MCVCGKVCVFVQFFSRAMSAVSTERGGTMGALYSKELERRWQQKGVFRRLAVPRGVH